MLELYSQLGEDDGTVLTIVQAADIIEKMAIYPHYHLYVGLRDKRIVATFLLLIMDKIAHGGTPAAIVEDVVVAADCRGQGIGTDMMQVAAKIALERGCYKLVLSSNKHRTAAHRFYQHLGFEPHGLSFMLPLESAAATPLLTEVTNHA